MNESIRTVIYVGVAAVVSLLAWASRPSAVEENVETLVGQPMFDKFDDPLVARSLEIVTFDEDSAELRTFKVAQENGRWVIPSHGDYPADAENQLRDAASSLVGLDILAVASEAAGDHALFGVVEPDKTKLKVGDEGVGTLVAMQDAKGNDLVRLVVGKEVADSSGKPIAGQRFVRKPSEEVVYITKLSLDKLPTDFDKWIEKDLLKINTFDIAKVTLKDYSVLPSQGGQFVYSPRMDAEVAWDNDKSAWSLDNLLLHSRQGSTPALLGEQEELNKTKLDDLKTALDDLKIVDVVRKPEGLGSSLKAGAELLQNQGQLNSLLEFGFLPVPSPDQPDKVDIYASNGEVQVDMKDGVRYVLRFGNVEGAQKATTTAQPGEKEEVKLNRYLFVTAQVSPVTLVAPPPLEEPAGPALPEKPATEKPATDKPASEKSGGGGADQVEADEPKADDTKKEAIQAEPAKPDPAKTETPAEPPKKDPAAEAREKAKLEHQRLVNEYNDKRKKAEARVAELNARFADWYYVISEDVYKKVHLGRGDIIKEGATARDEGFGVDAFRKLETDGIKPATSGTPAP